MKIKKLVFILVMFLLPATSMIHAAPSAWTGRYGIIESIQFIDGTNIVRMQITARLNPAACTNNNYIDFEIDNGVRSSTEQRLMLDSFHMALVTGRHVNFFVDGENCSTVATSGTIRIAIGFRAYRS